MLLLYLAVFIILIQQHPGPKEKTAEIEELTGVAPGGQHKEVITIIHTKEKTNNTLKKPTTITHTKETNPNNSAATIHVKENVRSASSSTREIERAIFRHTNEERKSAGLSKLAWDSKLAEIARDHSADMVENDYFSHKNLKGESPTERAQRQNYPTRKSIGNNWYRIGISENIGKMPVGNVAGFRRVSDDANDIGRAHVESWMTSPGHKKNILEPDSSDLGVGCAQDGIYYVCTQNFQ